MMFLEYDLLHNITQLENNTSTVKYQISNYIWWIPLSIDINKFYIYIYY
jgi:hypothetical protein